MKGKMDYEQLHFLGIKVVYKHMVDNGYEVLNVRRETDVNPQILALKEGKRIMVVVRTAKYPNMGVLLPHVAANVLEHGIKNNATCLFASVGIANADGETDEEMAEPVPGGQFYINFKGLQPFPGY
jgi:methanogenic corrinoid protein MtbC1